MPLYTISRRDKLPITKHPVGLTIEECDDIELLSKLGEVPEQEIISRLANDHLAFVAYVNHQPAAFGWMARGSARIGELNHTIVLPMRNRYLWNFRTLPAFRGMGIYPALLQYIVRFELNRADRFWIIHAPENSASQKGIEKSGFRHVGHLYLDENLQPSFTTSGITALEHELITDMGFAISLQEAATCWNCNSPFIKNKKKACCCSAKGNECIGHRVTTDLVPA